MPTIIINGGSGSQSGNQNFYDIFGSIRPTPGPTPTPAPRPNSQTRIDYPNPPDDSPRDDNTPPPKSSPSSTPTPTRTSSPTSTATPTASPNPTPKDDDDEDTGGGGSGEHGSGNGTTGGVGVGGANAGNKGNGGKSRGVASDPLVIDLDHDGVELTKLAGSQAYFDLKGNQFATQTSWVSKDDGFLALDQNNNGKIDNISELFGSATQNGFAELSGLDSNSDGVINASDAAYSQLQVWQDSNGNGVSEAGEILNNLLSRNTTCLTTISPVLLKIAS